MGVWEAGVAVVGRIYYDCSESLVWIMIHIESTVRGITADICGHRRPADVGAYECISKSYRSIPDAKWIPCPST